MQQRRTSPHHEVLEVAFNATEEQIKNAYKAKSLLWHPNRVPPNIENYDEVIKAFNIIFRRIKNAFDALTSASNIYISEKEESEYIATYARMSQLRVYNFSQRAFDELNQLREENKKYIDEKTRLLERIAELEKKNNNSPKAAPDSSNFKTNANNNNTKASEPQTQKSKTADHSTMWGSTSSTTRGNFSFKPKLIAPEGLSLIYLLESHYNYFARMDLPQPSVIYLDFVDMDSARKFLAEWKQVSQNPNYEFYFKFVISVENTPRLHSYFEKTNILCHWSMEGGRATKMLSILKEHFDFSNVPQEGGKQVPEYTVRHPRKFG